jgi:hypothetical protein
MSADANEKAQVRPVVSAHLRCVSPYDTSPGRQFDNRGNSVKTSSDITSVRRASGGPATWQRRQGAFRITIRDVGVRPDKLTQRKSRRKSSAAPSDVLRLGRFDFRALVVCFFGPCAHRVRRR